MSECAKILDIEEDYLSDILNEKIELEDNEIKLIRDKIKQKQAKKFGKYLDLIFRLCAVTMALVVLLLTVNGIGDKNVLIIFLSIAVACLSITNLPKNEKYDIIILVLTISTEEA